MSKKNITADASSKKLKSKKHLTLKECELQRDEYLNGWKRAQADYQNLQQRTMKERSIYSKAAKRDFVMQLLPLYNHLVLAFDHMPEELAGNQWVQGMQQIKLQFDELLNDAGVERIETEKMAFDAQLHEAVSREKSNAHESGMIMKELSPGYAMDGEVVIAAKVIVAE